MTEKCIKNKDFSLQYFVYGTGDKYVLLLPGFGQDAGKMETFIQHLGNDFTVFAMNNFKEGKSDVYNYPFITDAVIQKCIAQLLHDEKIVTFSILAYSLGGKIAFRIMEIFKPLIKKICLVAPDGIKINTWYNVITKNEILKFCFRYTIKHPKPFFVVVSFLKSIHFINSSTQRLAETYMKTPEQRQKVYDTWMCFKTAYTSIKSIQKFCEERKTDITFIFGKYDKIVSPKYMRRITKKVKGLDITLVEKGHVVFTAREAPLIRTKLI